MDNLSQTEHDQQLSVELTADQFQRLVTGDFGSDTPTVYDAHGTILLDEGRVSAPYQLLWQTYQTHRGFVAVERVGGTGRTNEGYLWISPHAVLVAVASHGQETVTLALSHLDTRFTLLIDLMALGRRSIPQDLAGGHVAINQDDLLAVLNIVDDPAAAKTGAHQLAQAVQPIAAASAEDIQAGQYEVISMAAEWDAGDHNEAESLVYVDTPHGYLVHGTERKMLRLQHQLEPAAGWYVFARAVGALPPPENMEQWQ